MWRLELLVASLLCIYTAAMPTPSVFRAVLHKFFEGVAGKVPDGDEYCFTVQGNNKMSLGNLTLLPEETWAFALLKSGMLEPRRKAVGGWQIRSSRDDWKALLQGSSNLPMGDDLLRGTGSDLAEVQLSKVDVTKFMQYSEPSAVKANRKTLLTVRLGKPAPNTALIASKQLTDNVDPPANRGIRQEQGALCDDMAVLIKETWIEIENDPGAMIILEEQLEAAKCWIDFEHLREDPEAYASEDESEDESDDESEDERDSNDEGGDDKGPDPPIHFTLEST